jgi:putative SOS response-associated peptidase YedK
MCNRYRALYGWHDIYEDFSQTRIPIRFPTPDQAPNLPQRWDIRPTNSASILKPINAVEPAAGLAFTTVRWGLIPFFHKGPAKAWKFLGTNCRGETAAETRMYRDAYKTRRCLVPADAFYEWTGAKGAKTKWLFTVQDQPRFCFAGLWDRCKAEDGDIETFTILTTAAGVDMAPYHDRQPVILDKDDHEAWLDPKADVARLLTTKGLGTLKVELAPPEQKDA